MSVAKAIEINLRRKFRRAIDKLPGTLLTANSRREIECRPLDVSPEGLGIFVEDEIDESEELILVTAHGEIRFAIIWSMENPGHTVGYRYGLKVLEPSFNLEEFFVTSGLI